MHSVLRNSLLFSLAVFFSGCVPTIIGGGLAAGGYTAMREKRVGDSLSDTKIETAIKTKLYKIDPELYSAVSVNVDERCVLLTGSVKNPEWITMAEKESWSAEGVEVVDNNLVVGEIPLSQVMQDSLITSKCRTQLICSSDIRSVNYKLKTMNGVVYVTGVARSEEELNQALDVLRKVGEVKKVVSYVNVMKS